MTALSSTTFASGTIPTFVPRAGLSNGHLMTVVAWARRRHFPALPEPDTRVIQVSHDTRVMARCYWQPHRSSRHTMVALHGLEGSSDVHYMRGLADKAWRAGWNAVLLNQRNCGGTEHLTPGLYHSGLTADPRAVINALASSDRLGRFGIVGYSLGGNLAMKLAGELPADPAPVDAVVAVCPTIDLERCVRAIERPANLPYQFNFVRNLKARMRRKALAWPGAFDCSHLGGIWTIRKFDDVYTAPHHGFGGAENYYQRASALRVVGQIAVPALILAAADDPFVPAAQFEDEAVRNNPFVQVHIASHGGHCAFLSQAGEAEYWAERTAMDFLTTAMPAASPSR
jgi:predicted alpha/beta-fold hydrolase